MKSQATTVETKRNLTGQINKLRRNQQILTILVLLFVAVIFWIIASLFSSQRSTKISPEVNKLAQPLNPSIDDSVFSSLETRRSFSEEELEDFPIMIKVELRQGEANIVPLGTEATPTPRPVSTPQPTQPNPSPPTLASPLPNNLE